MSSKQLITIFGATGNQGGSVVSAILSHPTLSPSWKIRGVTRNTSSARAQALAAKGVELVTADLGDLPSLERALAGSDAVFAVTDFWEKQDKALEVQQGKNIADAAKRTGVKHLIFSSLPNVSTVTNGKLVHVKHFDSKAEVEDYIRAQGIPASFFQPGPYVSSLAGSIKQQSAGSDTINLALPFKEHDTMPLFDVRDTGAYVAAMIANKDKILGRRVAAAEAFYTGPQIVEAVGKLVGKPARFNSVTDEQFQAAFPPFMAKEFGEMFAFMRENDYFGREGAKEEIKAVAAELGIKPTSLEEAIKNEDW